MTLLAILAHYMVRVARRAIKAKRKREEAEAAARKAAEVEARRIAQEQRQALLAALVDVLGVDDPTEPLAAVLGRVDSAPLRRLLRESGMSVPSALAKAVELVKEARREKAAVISATRISARFIRKLQRQVEDATRRADAFAARASNANESAAVAQLSAEAKLDSVRSLTQKPKGVLSSALDALSTPRATTPVASPAPALISYTVVPLPASRFAKREVQHVLASHYHAVEVSASAAAGASRELTERVAASDSDGRTKRIQMAETVEATWQAENTALLAAAEAYGTKQQTKAEAKLAKAAIARDAKRQLLEAITKESQVLFESDAAFEVAKRRALARANGEEVEPTPADAAAQKADHGNGGAEEEGSEHSKRAGAKAEGAGNESFASSLSSGSSPRELAVEFGKNSRTVGLVLRNRVNPYNRKVLEAVEVADVEVGSIAAAKSVPIGAVVSKVGKVSVEGKQGRRGGKPPMPEAKVAALIAKAKRPFTIIFLLPPTVADVESGGAAASIAPALDAESCPSSRMPGIKNIPSGEIDIAPALPGHGASVPSGASTDRPAPHFLLQRLLSGALSAPEPAARSANGRLGSSSPAQAQAREVNQAREGGHDRRAGEWSTVKGFLELLGPHSTRAVAPAPAEPASDVPGPAYPASMDGVSEDPPEHAASASEVTRDDALASSRERIESVMSAASAATAATPAPEMTTAPDSTIAEAPNNENDNSSMLVA